MRKTPLASRALRLRIIAACSLVLIAQAAGAQSIAVVRTRASDALSSGEYHRAVELYRRALDLNPNDVQSNRGLAESYFWLGEYDQAQRYAEASRTLDRRNPDVLTLSGRIAIGLGNLEDAEASFRRALELEPNNADAEIGLAELALAGGKSLDALLALQRALRIHPEHRKALLSLVLIHEEAGEPATAERYLEIALAAHGESPEAHILAAEFELRRGDTAAAAAHARIAQALDPLNAAAARIRATASVIDGNYAEAIATTEELLQRRRDSAETWYLRGVALIQSGRTDDGMEAFLSALHFAPDNETIRMVAEDTALNHYPMDAPVRAELAAHVGSGARRLEQEFQYRKALTRYQRALRLSPFDNTLRLAYAELHRTMGNTATYLAELRVIASSAAYPDGLETRIAVFENALSDSVSSRWGIDQFTIQRAHTAVAVYLENGAEPLAYPLSGEPLLAGIVRSMRSLPRLEVVSTGVVGDFAEAYRNARSEDVSFFIIFRFDDGPRSFGVSGTLYVARTGTPVMAISAVRTGPNRVSDVFVAVARRVDGLFPLRTEVIRRRGNRVVVDAGLRDGVSAGAELAVVPASALLIEPDTLGYGYDPSDVLGTISIVAVDDLVAEGVLAVRGLTDSVVTGDMAIIPGEGAGERAAGVLYPLLYDRVRALR